MSLDWLDVSTNSSNLAATGTGRIATGRREAPPDHELCNRGGGRKRPSADRETGKMLQCPTDIARFQQNCRHCLSYHESSKRRIFADWTMQPAGTAGSLGF
jgi:hypothetical protein